MFAEGSNKDNSGPVNPAALVHGISPRTVYIKEMGPADVASVEGLSDALAKLPHAIKLYAVHTLDGTRIAVLDNRDAAFAAARQQEMDPVSVH